ncbi:heme-binding protein [Elioraea sp.]|uniref:GlcG/HbpS family heme-binding protein n=1 Tax=Elioraea sp. TaxID=2185103 RepID=UPI0025C427D4|nr:heme-binding protein [Elioraea sp.]
MAPISESALPLRPTLTLAVAERAIAAATVEAERQGVRVTIAVVDDGGHIVSLRRMDGVHTGTVDVAIAKARTAAGFRRPSRLLAQGLAAGATALLALPGCLPIEGGVPLCVSDQVIGAVGVSGAAPTIDDAIAEAGNAALLAAS